MQHFEIMEPLDRYFGEIDGDFIGLKKVNFNGFIVLLGVKIEFAGN